MTHPVIGVDHVFILVNDLDKSAEHYRRLGFTLSPRGLHSKEKGTGNYTIMLPDDYFELLGIVNEMQGNLHQRQRLADQGEGLHAIACRIDSAQHAKAELAALGIQTSEVGAFQRRVQLSKGGEGIAAFETVSFNDEEVPQGMVFMCQHKTRETVWLPELIEHENGAIGLSAIGLISGDPQAAARGFARLYGASNVTADVVLRVHTGSNSADILVYNRDQAEQIYGKEAVSKVPNAAFSNLIIRVGDLSKARSVLDASGIVYKAQQHSIVVDPDDANGVILEFSQA
ncbi:glyoxalase-like domain protein (plasmid) [Ochrobactrum quorumnocens]|uniref:Glyoxalase-like domain protein n=1 Tax=Ochrobactrum quorumnocens TaxID=271865 RepID=A0A248UPN7_9HYPH|nr:VOC family protein [[Ochrobactrum] quorumnocens]ASV88596.1 glyoxalase-like domain protein [[Ochrobactrum] quorumnocens]